MISEARKNFLRSVALELIQAHGDQLQEVVVVLPSRRSKIFLLDHLATELKRPFWAPQCIIMPQLVSLISGEKLCGKTDALCLLYEMYKNVSTHPDDFRDFFKWGKILLNDFNDVDASLTDPAALFSDLRDVREIENWSFNETELSEGQQAFLKFWAEMGELYQSFFHEQRQRGLMTYHAMVKSMVQEPQQKLGNLKATELVFAGISAFSKAEEKLIYRLMDIMPVKLYHDLDEYYVEDELHEAGLLIRKSGLPIHSFVDRYFQNIPKKIFVNECSTATSEVLAVVHALQQKQSDELNETAVILAESSSLELMMNTLSQHDAAIHAAIGIPIKTHAFWRWMHVLVRTYTGRNKRGIHYRDLLEVIQMFVDPASLLDEQIFKRISTSHMVYYQSKDLDKWLDGFSVKDRIMGICNREQSAEDFVRQTLSVILELPVSSDWDRAALDGLRRICESMSEMMLRYPYFNHSETLGLLFQEVSGDEHINLEGEPVKGLQILDMVESRALDFKNVIIVGANENNLPGKGDYQSMIPFDLRQHYGLPMPQDREAMFAYNTYRLLQRAEKISFYYATVSGDFRSTERSRYITQLEYDLPRLHPDHQFVHAKLRVKEFVKNDRKIFADSFSEKRLDALFAAGISPSAINKFKQCPLDFYYRYILGLGEEESPEENMSVADFGTLIHDVLEEFYKPHMGSYPSLDELKTLSQNSEKHLKAALEKRDKIQHVDGGYNLLAIRIAQSMIEQYVIQEIARLNQLKESGLQPKVASVESVLFKQIDHEHFGWHKPVALKGKADRIDEIAGKYLIVDYKTGKVDQKNTSINQKKSLFTSSDNGKQLQLASYILMYASNGIPLENIDAGFYSFRKYKSGYQTLTSSDISLAEFISNFEADFMDWVRGVYATECFEHQSGSDFCQFCG